MPHASIDIGSNSILLTIVDDTGLTLHDEVRIVGLGRGLGDRGLLARDRTRAAEKVLGDYLQVCETHGVQPWEVKAVATSAARRAMNADTWLARLRRTLALPVRIITGDEEARLTWLGATGELVSEDQLIMMVDLGGGSTEIVLGTRKEIAIRTSLELGSVRMTELYLGHGMVDAGDLARLRNAVDTELINLTVAPLPQVMIGVAGTVTTLVSMVLHLPSWDAQRVHGFRLTRSQLATCIDKLVGSTAEQRRDLVPAAPERADYLLAGAIILDQLLAIARRPHLLVSVKGLRYGVLER